MKRILSMFLALALVLSAVPVSCAEDALETSTAEPAIETTAEPAIEPTEETAAEPATEATEETAAEPATEATEEAAAEPATEATEEAAAEPATEATEEAAAEPATEATEEAAAEPATEPTEETAAEPTTQLEATPDPDAFRAGPAYVSENTQIFADEVCEKVYGTFHGKSIVYVLQCAGESGEGFHLSGDHILKTGFNLQGSIVEGYVKYARVNYMTEEQVQAYQAEDHVDALEYRGVKLEQVDFAFAEEAAETPTEEPTQEPSEETTEEPTQEPTGEPTEELTQEPTGEPVEELTQEPTGEPVEELTQEPTGEPAEEPAQEPTGEPAEELTQEPTGEAAEEPAQVPSGEAAEEPTQEPTTEPTVAPVAEVTAEPTAEPADEWTEELENPDASIALMSITDNQGDQQYLWEWSEPIESYLVKDGDGYMAVGLMKNGNQLLVKYYDSAYNRTYYQHIDTELSLFGGFYAGTDAYYVVYGQNNLEEDDSKEVIRVVKYDKNWKRLGAASLYGANTTKPFAYGSLRMEEYGGYLYIRTSHEMYTSADGKNHQANLTTQVRTSDMVLVDAHTSVSNSNHGYVSHSFNQFIMADDQGYLIGLDHGDAYPRAILLGRYNQEAGSDSLSPRPDFGGYEAVVVFPLYGRIGDNYTGATLGGLEYSSSNYLVAGSSNKQDGSRSGIHNIFVTATSRTNFSESGTTLHWITDYTEKISASTPQLVKMGSDSFLLLWERRGSYETWGTAQMSYVFLNGAGQAVSPIYTNEGYLSDCKPTVKDGKAVWYVTDGSTMTFYTVSADGTLASITSDQADAPSDDFPKPTPEPTKVPEPTATPEPTPTPVPAMVPDTAYDETAGKLFTPDEPTYQGFAEFEGGWFYFTDGQQRTDYVGPVQIDGTYYAFDRGRVQTENMMMAFEGGLFAFNGGTLRTGLTGLAAYDGEQFVFDHGQYQHDACGPYLDPISGRWVYVNYGQYYPITDLVTYDGEVFYFVNGELASGFTGIVRDFKGTGLYIGNGQHYQITDLINNNGQICYVVNGIFAENFTGVVTDFAGTPFNIVNGVAQ